MQNLLLAPFTFFQSQPIGRVLNRLSADVEAVDENVMNALDGLLMAATNLMSSLVIIVSAAPLAILVMIPYLLLAITIQNWYRM